MPSRTPFLFCSLLALAPVVTHAQSTESTTSVADATTTSLDAVKVTARAAPVPVEYENTYQPTPDASTLRSIIPTLEIPQVVNVVPAQVLRDQRPVNMDDALANVSGISQYAGRYAGHHAQARLRWQP